MAARKPAMAKGEKEAKKAAEAADKMIAKKILEFMGLSTALKALKEMVEKIKEALRRWVEEKPTYTEKGYAYRETKKAGVMLLPTPIHQTSVEGLVAKIGLKAAADFLDVKRTALDAAIKAKSVNMTLKDLEEITTTAQGKPKIVAYYGKREISKIIAEISPEEEE